MRHIRLVAVIIITMLAACSDDKEKQSASAGIKDTVDNNIIRLDENNTIYSDWEDFYRRKDLNFSLDSFMLTDTIKGELWTTSVSYHDSFYTLFGKLIEYNKDSSAFVDAYSYSTIVEKRQDGKLYARAGEADNEVAIVNLKNNSRTRLLFCGPGCQLQKAFWYNENVVCIMGLSSEYSDEYFTPVVWFVNIHNGITIPYYYNSQLSIVEAEDYMRTTLLRKGVIWED